MLNNNDHFNNLKNNRHYYHKPYLPPQTSLQYKQDNKISCANNSFLSSSSSSNRVSKQRNQINNSMALADAGASGNYISVSNKKIIQKLVATDERTKIAVTVCIKIIITFLFYISLLVLQIESF